MRDYCCYQITMVCRKKTSCQSIFFFSDVSVHGPAARIIGIRIPTDCMTRQWMTSVAFTVRVVRNSRDVQTHNPSFQKIHFTVSSRLFKKKKSWLSSDNKTGDKRSLLELTLKTVEKVWQVDFWYEEDGEIIFPKMNQDEKQDSKRYLRTKMPTGFFLFCFYYWFTSNTKDPVPMTNTKSARQRQWREYRIGLRLMDFFGSSFPPRDLMETGLGGMKDSPRQPRQLCRGLQW